MQERCYTHLSAHDRRVIAKLLAEKKTVTEIAKRIGRHKSTVSRELRRNADILVPDEQFVALRVLPKDSAKLDEYLRTVPTYDVTERTIVWSYSTAQATCEARARRAAQERRRKDPETRKWVIEKVRIHWSPEQIAGRSEIDGPQTSEPRIRLQRRS